ncbi:hypothetical protein DFS34DRAFT_320089 [Phlyctochytrium arcticum]|nr:hypothetical protein DFS34DRAFT_320089 [Phlyctochytrium arcticum]
MARVQQQKKRPSSFHYHPHHQAFAVWMLACLLTYWTSFPVEWLFMSALTLTIFSQAYSLGFVVFSVLLSVIFISDAIVYMTVPYEITTFNASFIVHSFLVYGIHGFGLAFEWQNLKAWLLVAAMLLLRFTIWNPWPETAPPPPTFMAPLAAHCTVAGAYYFLWKVLFLSYKNFEQISYFFTVVLPDEPVIILKEVSDTHIKFYWTAESVHGAEVQRYLIELDGQIVGEVQADDRGTAITGLAPGSRHRIRIWAATASRRIRTASRTLLVKTTESQPLEISQERSGGEDETQEIVVAPPPPPDQIHVPADYSQFEKHEAEVDNELAKADEDLAQIKRQYEEILVSFEEAKSQFEIEKQDINSEIARLTEEKKSTEGPRSEIKARLKTLEDSKRQADGRLSQIERKLKKKQDEAREAAVLLDEKKRDVVDAERQWAAARLRRQEDQTSYRKRRTDLEPTLERKQAEIEALEEQLEEKKKVLGDISSAIQDYQSKLKSAKSTSSSHRQTGGKLADYEVLAAHHGLAPYDDITAMSAAEWSALFTLRQNEYNELQAQLANENRLKVLLLQRLATASRRRLGLPTSTVNPSSTSASHISSLSPTSSAIGVGTPPRKTPVLPPPGFEYSLAHHHHFSADKNNDPTSKPNLSYSGVLSPKATPTLHQQPSLSSLTAATASRQPVTSQLYPPTTSLPSAADPSSWSFSPFPDRKYPFPTQESTLTIPTIPQMANISNTIRRYASFDTGAIASRRWRGNGGDAHVHNSDTLGGGGY